MNLIEATVQGIPCLIKVTSFTPERPGRYYGPPEDCYPEEPAEFSYDVLDRRGRPAPWLERKVTDTDRERIGGLILEAVAETA